MREVACRVVVLGQRRAHQRLQSLVLEDLPPPDVTVTRLQPGHRAWVAELVRIEPGRL
jgi:hypothetical protein